MNANNRLFSYLLTCAFIFPGAESAPAQHLKNAWGNLKKGVGKIPAQVADQVLKNPQGTVNAIITGVKANSQIRKSDFFQLRTIPPTTNGDTRYALAGNLLIDLQGQYPAGYAASWNYFNRNAPLTFTVDNYVVSRPLSPTEAHNIMIGDYKGKAALLFTTGCDCIADIIIDSVALVGEQTQTFKVTNFRKFWNNQASGDKCAGSGNIYTAGGFEGKLSLSARPNGDIRMDLVIECYRNADRWVPAGVSYRYTAAGVVLENEMTAEKARATLAKEEAARQRQKDFLARSRKQVDSLMKVIARKYPGPECRSCFYRNRGYRIDPVTKRYYYVNGDGYAGSETDLELSTSLLIRNKCNYNITFIGIQQLYDEDKGYYYTDVTRTMEADYEYSANQGIFSYAFTSILGMNPDFDIQDEYNISAARLNSVQWVRVIKSKP